MEGYKISTNIEEMDFPLIHHFISQSYWAKGIPEQTFQKSLSNSLCFGVLTNSSAQVGFARLITDRATFAYLADLFILEEYRGKGLANWLMENIIAHPDLQGLRRITLATRDAHGLYEKFGFKPPPNTEILMEVWDPDVYTSS